MMILFTEKVSPKYQERLRKHFPSAQFVFCKSREESDKYIGDAEVLVTYGGDVDELLVTHAHHLKWIMVLSAGVDQLPFPIIIKRKILVTNARGIHKGPMAEYAIRSEEHMSELQSRGHLVCRLLLEKKKKILIT